VTRLLLWDFSGTLAAREGGWSACLLETVDEHEPRHRIVRDGLDALVLQAFPWNRPELAHPELCEAREWWRRTEAALAGVYEVLGLDGARARELARLARERYVDASIGWRLFDDACPALERLRERGWTHAILSNHVPELPALVADLGLASLVDTVMSSAAIGYEKPHPGAFQAALEACGRPDRVVAVGDDLVADVQGAEAAGIPAVLVRAERGGASRCARDLAELERLLEDESS
jgi:putative hydrolase of the HAD superfamily